MTAAFSIPWPSMATSRANGDVDDRDPLVADDPVPVAGGVGRRRAGRPLATSATTTVAPAAARWRAATNPSPPLLPGPARMTIGPRPQRSVSIARARAAAATAAPACSMSCSPGMPSACALRSAPVIACGRHRRPRGGLGPAAAQAAQVQPEELGVVGRERRRGARRVRARGRQDDVMTGQA